MKNSMKGMEMGGIGGKSSKGKATTSSGSKSSIAGQALGCVCDQPKLKPKVNIPSK